MSTTALRIGIDLGGTKIEGLALDRDGAEVARHRIVTPPSYERTLTAIEGLVTRLVEEASDQGAVTERVTVGVGIPGSLSPTTGLVRNANSRWLNGHALDDDLAEKLGRPVRIMNDANCFALSEARDGAGAHASVVFGVILGTGTGGGVVVDGMTMTGRQAIAGEWGHNPLPWPTGAEAPGPDCQCGRRGCLETFVSGPGMARDHEEVTGQALSPRDIATRAEAGDAEALASYGRYVNRLARGLATVINVLDPDIVVLGGGLSNLPTLPQDVQGSLDPYVFTDQLATPVVRNLHGDSSGVRGAAWLWPVEPGRGT